MRFVTRYLLTLAYLVVYVQAQALLGSKPEEDAYGINADSSGLVTFEFFLNSFLEVKKVEIVVLQTDPDNGSKLNEAKIKTYSESLSPDFKILSIKAPIIKEARVCYWIKKMEFENSKDDKIKDGPPVCFVEGKGDPPSEVPSLSPSSMPSDTTAPSSSPSMSPGPSAQPSTIPTSQPSLTPTGQPSAVPSANPSGSPTAPSSKSNLYEMSIDWRVPNLSAGFSFRIFDASDGSTVFSGPLGEKTNDSATIMVESDKDYCYSGSNPDEKPGNNVKIVVDGTEVLSVQKDYRFLTGTYCFTVNSDGSTSSSTPPPTPSCEKSDSRKFNICIEMEDMSEGLLAFHNLEDYFKKSFIDAKQKWSQVLLADDGRAPHVIPLMSDFVVDDLWIEAAAVLRDGKGGLLGYAGISISWYDASSQLRKPVTGYMGFDAYDIKGLKENDLFHKVVIHEIGHILGIGTLWATNNLWNGKEYQGEHANKQYVKLLDAQGLKHKDGVTVPIETDYGPGTRFGHWDEECLDHELMTGFLDSGDNILSAVTVGGLHDLGYTVDYNAAEPYEFRNYNEKVCKQQKARNLRGGGTSRRWRLLHGRGDMHEDDEKAAFEKGQELLKITGEGGGNHMLDIFWEDQNENIFVVHVSDVDE